MSSCNLCGAPVDPENSLRWRKDGFRIVQCASCGLVFRSEPPSYGDLAEIYTSSYFRDDVSTSDKQGYSDYLGDAELHRHNARRRLRHLERHVPTGRLLDVGCAAGFFVAEARARGWDAEGIDVSSEMVDWGRVTLGVPVSTGTLRELETDTRAFSAITMWDYIEHAIDPVADVARCSELLAEGGILALSTGDVGSPLARLSGSRWHLLTPHHHNYFFSRRTLRRLLTQAGLEILSMRATSSSYSVAHLVYKLQTLARIGAIRRAAATIRASRVSATDLPVNLFDIVTVVARKPVPGGATIP
jgi:2-polyprenyl-3-methyl-5-hydroxy-6-metoxy-1,4-benzoquinol methylase